MGARALYGTLLAEGRQELAAAGARFLVHRFRNLRSGEPALALTLGDVRGAAPLLARVHSSCVTSEALGACDCDCAGQLEAALARASPPAAAARSSTCSRRDAAPASPRRRATA